MSEGSPREKVLTVRKSSYTDEDDDTVNCSINSFAIGFTVNLIISNLTGLRKNFEISEFSRYRG